MVKKIESYADDAVRLQSLAIGTVLEASPFWVMAAEKFCPGFSDCSRLTGCVEDLFKQCAREVEKTGVQIGKDNMEKPEIVRLLDQEFERQLDIFRGRTNVQPLKGKNLLLLEKPRQLWVWNMDVLATPPAISTYTFHVGILNEDDEWKTGDPHTRFNIGDDSRYCCVYTLPTIAMDERKAPKMLPVNLQFG